MTATGFRRRTTAVAALALAAAACGGGGGTTAPEPAAATPTTTAAPTTAAPGPATTLSEAERCAAEGADLAEQAAAEAREIMAAGPSGLGLERLDQLRGEARLTLMAVAIGCPGGWGHDDEDRYQDIIAAAQAPDDPESGDEPPVETADETGPGETGGDNGAAAEQPPAPTPAPAGPAPDDPEWEDTAPPAPPAPPADQITAAVTLPKTGLRSIAEVRPYVCEHQPAWCAPTGGRAEWWTWDPIRLAVGSRWDMPSAGVIDISQEIPAGSGIFRVTFDASYFYTVTGFDAQPEPGVGGILYVDVLLHVETARKWGWRGSDGAVWDCIPDGDARDRCERDNPANIALGALILPEDGDGIERDAAGGVTAATVLLLWPSPPPGGSG